MAKKFRCIKDYNSPSLRIKSGSEVFNTHGVWYIDGFIVDKPYQKIISNLISNEIKRPYFFQMEDF